MCVCGVHGKPSNTAHIYFCTFLKRANWLENELARDVFYIYIYIYIENFHQSSFYKVSKWKEKKKFFWLFLNLCTKLQFESSRQSKYDKLFCFLTWKVYRSFIWKAKSVHEILKYHEIQSKLEKYQILCLASLEL